jgi:hypothetical protein
VLKVGLLNLLIVTFGESVTFSNTWKTVIWKVSETQNVLLFLHIPFNHVYEYVRDLRVAL